MFFITTWTFIGSFLAFCIINAVEAWNHRDKWRW